MKGLLLSIYVYIYIYIYIYIHAYIHTTYVTAPTICQASLRLWSLRVKGPPLRARRLRGASRATTCHRRSSTHIPVINTWLWRVTARARSGYVYMYAYIYMYVFKVFTCACMNVYVIFLHAWNSVYVIFLHAWNSVCTRRRLLLP